MAGKTLQKWRRAMVMPKSIERDLKVLFTENNAEKYMRPFVLDVNIKKRRIVARIMHRTRQKTIACVATNSKDLRNLLPSRVDLSACKIVGEILADRAKEADCYTCAYTGFNKVEGRLAAIIDSLAKCGISVYHSKKQVLLTRTQTTPSWYWTSQKLEEHAQWVGEPRF